MVSYCNQKGVAVEVTLFDPWSGSLASSPWNPANNHQQIGFTQRKYFTTFDSPSGHVTAPNQAAFNKQKELVRKVVLELAQFPNVYWEIANEPDINASSGVGEETIEWHVQIRDEIRAAEAPFGVEKPIGVNIQGDANVTELWCYVFPSFCVQYASGNETPFDGVNGHYVDLADPSRLGAPDLLRKRLKDVRSFNEGKIYPGAVTAEGVRAEAWEFMFHGGGVYDHVGYNWASAASAKVRQNLGLLKQVLPPNIEGYSVSSLRREAPWWCPTLAEYGTPSGSGKLFWGAIAKEGVGYYLYIHHSQVSTNGFQYYVPQVTQAGYRASLQVDLGVYSGSYKVEWVRPSDGLILAVQTVNWLADGSLLSLRSPFYDFDILLRIRRQ